MKRALSLLMAIATVLTSMVFVISFSASAADSNIIWSQNFNDLTSWDGDVLASAGITGTWYGGNSGSRPDSKFTNSEGDYAVAIESVSGGKSEFYTPYFDVTPGDIIRITVKYRVLEQGSTTNGVIFTLYNAGSMTIPGWGEYTNPTPVSDYYKVEDVYCTVPEGTTSFRFAPGAANGAKIAFDDIIVQKVDSIPSQLKVVWSKDFDDADDWNGNTPLGLSNSNVPFEKAVGQGINGTNAVKITGTTYSLASVSLTSGKKYLVTFKYKALTDTDFYVYQQVYGTYPAIGNGGVQEVNYPNTYKLKAGSGWQMYSFVLNANDTSKDCVANFGPYVVTSGAQVLVDDYVIYELGDSTAADATSTLMWDVNFRALGAPAGAGSTGNFSFDTANNRVLVGTVADGDTAKAQYTPYTLKISFAAGHTYRFVVDYEVLDWKSNSSKYYVLVQGCVDGAATRSSLSLTTSSAALNLYKFAYQMAGKQQFVGDYTATTSVTNIMVGLYGYGGAALALDRIRVYDVTAGTPVYAETNRIFYDFNGENANAGYNANYNPGEITVIANHTELESGKALVKWNTAADGTGTDYYPGDVVRLSGDLKLYAVWGEAKPTYSITVDPNLVGGTIAPNKVIASEGDKVTVIVAPAYDYSFVKGSLTANGTAVENFTFTMPAENVVLSASFKTNSYTAHVSYNFDSEDQWDGDKNIPTNFANGIGAGKSEIVTGVGVNETDAWKITSTATSGTVYAITPYGIYAEGGKTYKFSAKYKLIDATGGYGIQFYVQYATETNPATIGISATGTGVNAWTMQKTVSEDWQTFEVIWTSTADTNFVRFGPCVYGGGIALVDDMKIEMVIEPSSVTFDANGATGTGPSNDTLYAYGETLTIPEATGLSNGDKKFLGWNTSANGTGNHYMPGETYTFGYNSLKLYAIWESKVTIDAGDNIVVSGEGNYAPGSSVTVKADKPGFIFNGWYTDIEGEPVSTSKVYTFTVNGDITLIPIFDGENSNQGSLSIGLGGGSVDATIGNDTENLDTDLENIEIPQGVVIKLEAVANDGYVFSYWKNSLTGKVISRNATIEITVGIKTAVEAVFVAKEDHYVIFVDKNGAILKAGAVADGEAAEAPDMTNKAFKGYVFTGWNKDFTSVKSDLYIVALYEVAETTYDVNVTGGTLTEEGPFVFDSYVTVVANEPEEGKFFKGWSLNKAGTNLVSYDETYSFFVTGKTNLYAIYVDSAADATPAPIVKVILDGRAALGEKDKSTFRMNWYLPEGFTVIEAGILRTYDQTVQSDLTFDNNSDAIKQTISKVKSASGQYMLHVKHASTANLFVNGYLTYADSQGNTYTAYSGVQLSMPQPI